MEKRAISAVISTQAVDYRPGGPPATFEVTVTNEGNVPAQFQMEILAAGANRNLKWYRLDPEISVLKPSGSQTKFTVAVIDAPLLGFVGTINVTIRIFSPQLKDERKYLLRLNVAQGDGYGQLVVDLPVRQFQVNPREVVDIPVRVRNIAQQPVDVILSFLNMPQSWIVGGTERRLLVEPGGQTETIFQCQPPVVKQAPSQLYPFVVEAKPQVGAPSKAEGSVEVLPIGFVEFSCPEPKQSIPAKGGVWWPNFEQEPVQYVLYLKNCSNLRQTVNLQLQGKDVPKCAFTLDPQEADLNLGTTASFTLSVQKPRPWIGIPQSLNFEAEANLPDQRLGNPEPATQVLELRLLPILPVWMQLALLLLLLALIYLLTRIQGAEEGHIALVNAVRISSDSKYVLSASDDRSIRRWSVGNTALKPDGQFVADAGDAVRALRFSPQGDQVAAGLGNGPIQLWNLATRKKDRQFVYEVGDRTFDLAFTPDGRYLYSGHGSGQVLQWDLLDTTIKDLKPSHVFKLNDKFKFVIQSLVILPVDHKLVSVGQYNRIVIWDLDHPDARPQRISMEQANAQGGQNDYLRGAALSGRNRLATADSQGYVTLWNIGKCEPLTAETAPVDGVAPGPGVPIDVQCPTLERWSPTSPDFSVNTVFLTRDGSQLLSGGNDHKVTLWNLTNDGPRQSKLGQVLDKRSSNINTVEMGRDDRGFFAVSGDEEFRVTMKRVGTN